jgi:hypothetical protein
MKKSRLFLSIILLVPFFAAYAQENPEGLSLKQVIDFIPQDGETVYSVLSSADGTAAVVAASKVAALLKTRNYFVYLGSARLGPFEHYIQSGNKWEAFNGGGDYIKSNHYIGTAKNYYQSTTKADISKFKVFDGDKHILIDYDSGNTPNEYYTAAGIIPVKDNAFFANTQDIVSAYIRMDRNGNNVTNSVIFGNKIYGPYEAAYGPYLSYDDKRIAYWTWKKEGLWTAYVGDKTYGPFKPHRDNSVGEIVWSPNNTEVAFWAAKTDQNPDRDVTVYAGDRSWGPYRYAGNPAWSPDGKQVVYWVRDSTNAYYLYSNGEKKAGPYQDSPVFIDFVFDNKTLAYVADGMLYVGDEFVRIDSYRKDSLTMNYAHRRLHFAYFNSNSKKFISSDFQDAFDEMPAMGYLDAADNFFALGLRKPYRAYESPQAYSVIFNDTKNSFDFDKDFYKAIFSPDKSKYALVFQERKNDEEYAYTGEGYNYKYTASLGCYYFIPGMSSPQFMYTLKNISASREQAPEVLPFGWTAHNTFVYVTKEGDVFYLVENGKKFGPYTSITDNYAGAGGGINWTALSGNKVFSIVSE